MRSVLIDPDFESWRDAARGLLREGVPPGEVVWLDATVEQGLFSADAARVAEGMTVTKGAGERVPAAFLDLAGQVAAHSDPRRWSVLYEVLWRLTRGGERHLLEQATDRDVHRLGQWRKAVARDLHKMHAFVRFRLVGEDLERRREQYVAWFEPEHRIVRLAAPFFQKRFTGMDWSILTPDQCAHWDGTTLHFTPGVSRAGAPRGDALDELWRAYYKSIFNPARLKVKAMQAEMPKKYWKNLPEATLIEGLIAGSGARVGKMLETEGREEKAAPKNAYLEQLRRKNADETGEGGVER
jgi:DNA polymerase